MRVVSFFSALVFLSVSLVLPERAAAQSATSGTVVGTITDPQAAAAVGATVELRNDATNQTFQQTTNASGQYAFPSVTPGVYKITVTMSGFRTATIANFGVDVAKSYTVDFKLELGQVSEVVQVEAQTRVELQTTDSTVGNVINVTQLPRMPALSRQVNELLLGQPGTTPTGEVTGARSDQSTFALDGIDVTNNSVGGTGTYIFLPIDSIDEFRVGVANPNATFGRGAGGQVAIISRSGSSSYHGATYWYHQNDNLNANTWDLNRLGKTRPELKDNRFGFNTGGPLPFLWSKKTFFFVNYEGRRFPRNTLVQRIVPTDTLRKGILRFEDATGATVNYDLKTSTLCGTANNQPCDPRGLGLSPTVNAIWTALPPGNDPTRGDQLNTVGFTTTVGNPLSNDFYNLRLDQNVTSKWHANVAFRYFRQTESDAGQVSLFGSNPKALRTFPLRQNYLSAGLAGQITRHLSGEFGFGWVRQRSKTVVLTPDQAAKQEAFVGTAASGALPSGFIAVDLGATNVPIDVGTQVARTQGNDNRNFQWNADLNWIRGTHTFQFGSHVRYLPTKHLRNDKVLGSVGSLVAQLQSSSTTIIPQENQPPTCPAGSATTTNCIKKANLDQWNSFYATALGLVDNVTILAVRDGKLSPLPFGSLLESDTRLWAPEMYFQDVWHIKPSLTVTLGVTYGWQTAPTERLGRYTIQIDGGTQKPITSDTYFQNRQQSAATGQIFNPAFAFLPVNTAGTSVFNVDWHDIAPRVGVAWNPDAGRGFLGKLLGNRKTVLRSGFGIVYDRQNTVQSVIIPSLGIGFAQTLNFTAPACNITGPGGAGCVPTDPNLARNRFRAGVDGVLPVPQPPAQSIPISPCWGLCNGRLTLFPELLSFQVDPNIKVGRNYEVDFTIQRELPGNMLVEVGYSGRFGRKLPQSMSLSQSPINFKDSASGQTFAQAFDAVATAVRGGAAVTNQPWFENQFKTGGTAALVAGNNTDFINGNVSSIFLSIDRQRILAGLKPFNNYISGSLFFRSSTGTSNYSGLFVTLHKGVSHGLTFDSNYTFSRSLDQVGAIQNAAGFVPNSFDLFTEYGPSSFDINHIVNGRWVYDLPFSSSNAVLKRVIGGWYLSGIFTARTAAPLIVVEGNQVWGAAPNLFNLGNNTGAIPTVDPSSFGSSVHSGVAGSGGVGSAGDPAKKGSGLNLFGDPASVFAKFRPVQLSKDGRSGRSRPVRGLAHWNLDTSLGKKTKITERTQIVFAADFFNLFNNAQFADPSLSLLAPQNFGVLTTQFVPASRTNGARWIQLSLRIEF